MSMNPLRWSFRTRMLAAAAACFALIGFAVFSQLQWGLDPCPLCIFQRIAFMVTGVLFLVGAVHGPGRQGRRVYGLLVLVSSAVGAGVAIRHVWLQSLPADQAPACGPGLGYMMDTLPLGQVLVKVFAGSGDCTQVDWTFVGLSMPGWTLVCFVLLGFGGLLAGFVRR